MKRKIDISLKKEAKQARSKQTVRAIVEAATYILKRAGPPGFTANQIAERAGVNIASFYQYFPNKEAVLFHIARLTWEKELAKLSPILTRPGADHANKLREFIREFFLIEAAEAPLRQKMKAASIDLKDTKEFRALIASGAELTRGFIREAVAGQDDGDLDFNVDFIVLLVTSFAERSTDERTPRADLVRQAELLAGMVIERFGVT